MKKFLFGFAALAVLATASCKKDDDSSSTPSNTFKIGSESYTVSNFTMLNNTILLTNTGGATAASSLTFTFGSGTATPSAGSYKIVSNPDETNEVAIAASTFRNSAIAGYTSQDGTSAMLTLTKDGDKLVLTLPEVDVKQQIGGSEVVKISASAKQP